MRTGSGCQTGDVRCARRTLRLRDGILYPQRIRDFSRIGFIEALAEAGLLI